MKTNYVTKVDSGIEGRVYVTGFGINVLIPKNQLQEMINKGFVEGFTKPYLNQFQKDNVND